MSEIPAPPVTSSPTVEPPARSMIGQMVAIVGIVAGFVLLIVPGILAVRSYRRWTGGEIRRPTFAWLMAGASVGWVALVGVGFYLLYGVPLIDDDFSDTSSGWRTDGPPRAMSYADGGYEISIDARSTDDPLWTGVVWDEGSRPNVGVEVDVAVLDGTDRSLVGVACADQAVDLGYAFLIAPDGTVQIRLFSSVGSRVLAEGRAGTPAIDEGVRIRGECRAGFGEHEVRLLVDGELIVTAPVPEAYISGFDAVALAVVPAEGEAVGARFDDLYAIAIQPSADG